MTYGILKLNTGQVQTAQLPTHCTITLVTLRFFYKSSYFLLFQKTDQILQHLNHNIRIFTLHLFISKVFKHIEIKHLVSYIVMPYFIFIFDIFVLKSRNLSYDHLLTWRNTKMWIITHSCCYISGPWLWNMYS